MNKSTAEFSGKTISKRTFNILVRVIIIIGRFYARDVKVV